MLTINTLWLLLGVLIFISCFFSVAETAYMSVNRYRLRHMARQNHPAAKRANLLLERPDRLLGVILLGDTFADIFASAIATLIAVHYLGNIGALVATISLTLIVLIFGELAPKTFAALRPIPIVLKAAWPLWMLLKLLSPIVWFANTLSNGLLWILGIRGQHHHIEHFTTDELHTIVTEAGQHIPQTHQKMLLQLLELEKFYVEDIMIPCAEIVGIDFTRTLPAILEQLTTSQHTRLPVFTGRLDNILGMLHVRSALNLLAQEKLSKANLEKIIEKPYFIPEGTSLTKQLLQFCQRKIRAGLVVNEYGDILGLVTLEDIMEEVVGEFTTNTATAVHKDILIQADGSYLIDGGITLRVLNRTLQTAFLQTGPKTLNGLITEYLETIPPANVCVCIANQRMEILQIKDNMIRTVRFLPAKDTSL